MAKGTISAYANDLGIQASNLSCTVSEPSPLCCSQSFQVSGEIKDVKGQNDFLVFEHIA